MKYKNHVNESKSGIKDYINHFFSALQSISINSNILRLALVFFTLMIGSVISGTSTAITVALYFN